MPGRKKKRYYETVLRYPDHDEITVTTTRIGPGFLTTKNGCWHFQGYEPPQDPRASRRAIFVPMFDPPEAPS